MDQWSLALADAEFTSGDIHRLLDGPSIRGIHDTLNHGDRHPGPPDEDPRPTTTNPSDQDPAAIADPDEIVGLGISLGGSRAVMCRP